jgi:hypothetical protein
MKRKSPCRSFVRSAATAAAFLAVTCLAQENEASTEKSAFDWFKPLSTFTGEYSFEETYVGEAAVRHSGHIVDGFSESDTVMRFILTPRIKLGVLRLGAEWEHFSFGFPSQTQLPNTLQSFACVIGLDTQFSDSILLRVEASPGLYGTNNLELDDVNAPFLIGGTYIYSANLQIILGASVDVQRKYPVIPGAGVRWKFARQWIANAVLPSPRLEFELSKNLTLYVGGDFKETNFRVSDDFGDTHRNRKLNLAVLTYSEVRAGVGANWKILSFATITAEAGYQPYRSFDFHREGVRFHENGSAPYGMISVHGAF